MLWSGILFYKVVRAVAIANLVILDMLFLTSFVLSLRAVLVTKLVISGIDIYRWYISIWTTSVLTNQ